jgi:nicotinate-nucleotide pyrophosphorylase (carboxylating)
MLAPDVPLQHPVSDLPETLRHPTVVALLRLSLIEDLSASGQSTDLEADPARGDVTSQATLSPDARLEARLIAKEAGIFAGGPLAQSVFRMVSEALETDFLVADGTAVEPGQTLATVTGPGRALLAAERTAINVMARCSGIATLTRRYVEAVAGTAAAILDTRKTQPGMRRIDKYAVQRGGGQNHRLGLFDMVLIKDNHIDGAGSITAAIERVRERYGDTYRIEVEVKTLDEFDEALAQQPDVILLDNMDLETMRTAVHRRHGDVALEASGNVTLGTVRAVAETGVDAISVGALTHSAPALDLSLRIR